ncbi:pyridoxal phosphate-dependent decarboxylase family protein [Streptomyces sp. NPDC007088]|uniref:pyridoxal phosphate-dependent decarboxylase family protein n=1 Tax=Streptomyces sp. NPDC007088 TaxID=3364773 RepID=UPI0036971261
MTAPPPLAGGPNGPDALRPLLDTVLTALAEGAAQRRGPLPAGGPTRTATRTRSATDPVLPDTGSDPHTVLHTLVTALTHGAADPAHPHCAAHLHCPPLAVATAADLAASALNPSLDSWDQAPAATALEQLVTHTLATEVHGHPQHPGTPRPDALVTTGATEANQLAALLAREKTTPDRPLRLLHGANAHHSVPRAAWLLGLPATPPLPTPRGVLDPTTLHHALQDHTGHPVLVTATAGTTDAGLIDPLPALADLCAHHGARLHIDAAYGGTLLFSPTHRPLLDGLDRAHTVSLDLHKLGWQPVAAGLLTLREPTDLAPLNHQADYLNADDDTQAGIPDLLGRSLRTTRRPDILKIAVTLRTLGRTGLAQLIDTVCAQAHTLADLVTAHPRLELHSRPTISTVLFRPTHSEDRTVAHLRRSLLHEGTAVLGRAHLDGRLWLKATLLNPHTTTADLTALLTLVEGHLDR